MIDAVSTQHTGSPHRRRSTRMWAVRGAIALLALLLTSGAVAARTVTVTVMASHGAITDLLPASTILYAHLDLDPRGSQGMSMQAIEHAFTSQPGWSHIQRMMDAAFRTQAGQQGGDSITWQTVQDLTDGQFALAVTDASALAKARSGSRAGQDGLVVIAGLKVQASLADLVTSHHIGVPSRVASYRGVDLYRVGSLGKGAPTYAALLNGYAVIGATSAAVAREIDVQQGRIARLTDSPRFRQLLARVSTDGPFFAYVDARALLDAEAGTMLAATFSGSAGTLTQSQLRALRAHLGAVGFAVSAQSGGLDLHMAALTGPGRAGAGNTPDRAAQALPAGTLAYLSFANLLAAYRTSVNQLIASGALRQQDYDQFQAQLGDLPRLLDGEVAMGVLPIDATALQHVSGSDTTGLPLALLIDVRRHPDAASIVGRTLGRLFPGDPHPLGLQRGVTAHGAVIYRAHTGYGYGLIARWLVVSPAISRVSTELEGVISGRHASLATSDPFRRAQAAIPGPRGMDMLIDLAAVRADLEASLLPSMGAAERQQYAQDARPMLAPLRMVAIRAGVSADGASSDADLFVGIGRR